MRQIIAVVLSFLTGIGGHYVNRRRDKAILFFALLVLWSVGVYVSMTLYASQIVGLDDFEALQSAVRKYWKLPIVGLVLIWLSSIVVTYRDSKKSITHRGEPWTIPQLLKSIGLSVASSIILIYQVWMLSHWVALPQEIGTPKDTGAKQVVKKMANEIVFPLEGYMPTDWTYKKLPAGNGFFRGKVDLQGKSFANLSLQLTVNKVYKTATTKTDNDGIFMLKMPAGLWHLDAVAMETWHEGIQEGQYELVVQKPHERSTNVAAVDQTVAIIATTEGDPAPLFFSIRPSVELLWPQAGDAVQKGTVDASVIKWQSFPAAEEYLVALKAKPKAGSRGSFFNLLTRRVRNTELPLSQLNSIEADKSEMVYMVTVYALQQDGTLLSKSSSVPQGRIFELTDNKIIIGEFPQPVEQEQEEPLCSEEQLLAIEQSQLRLQAVATLIQNGLLTEAGNMLSQINGLMLPGHKERITGYFLAAKGECDKANLMFDQAKNKNPGLEIPQSYRQKCLPVD